MARGSQTFSLPEGISTRYKDLVRVMAGFDRFVAIDFETASNHRESACAVGLVVVQHGKIIRRVYRLIRPLSQRFDHTWIHGISWRHVVNEATFAQVWPVLQPHLNGAGFVAAHNAAFDRAVLQSCCEQAGLPVPQLPFCCTVRTARALWKLRPAKLPNVCEYLGIPLDHHHAASDAEACALIVVAAQNSLRQLAAG